MPEYLVYFFTGKTWLFARLFHDLPQAQAYCEDVLNDSYVLDMSTGSVVYKNAHYLETLRAEVFSVGDNSTRLIF